MLRPLIAPDLGREDYARALAALHGPLAALEARLAGFAPAEVFRARLPDLESDLADLATAPRPLSASLPEASTDMALIGQMYVLEGSQRGGAFIARSLTRSLPLAPRRYFAGAGEADRWQRFWDLAGSRCPIERAAEAIGAARAVFAFFQAHLDACHTVQIPNISNAAPKP